MLQHKQRRWVKIGVPLLVLCVFALALTSLMRPFSYDVSFNEQRAGSVRDLLALQGILEQLKDDSRMSVDQVNIAAQEALAIQQFTEPLIPALSINSFSPKAGYHKEAALIMVNNEPILALSDEKQAQEIIDIIVSGYTTPRGNRELKEYSVVEDVRIVKATLPEDEIMDWNTAINVLSSGYSVMRQHVVSRGESLWSIAHNHGISIPELREANPEIKNDTIHPGQDLNLQIAEPYIHVRTVEQVTTIEYQPFSTRVVSDNSMYTWERKTLTPGKRGETEVTYEIISINGKEEERSKTASRVLSLPVTQVVARGTKSPARLGTGQFIWPILDGGGGLITDRFGWTGRRHHTGVDIAIRSGTPIYAADSGTVTIASSQGRYGLMVKIEHGNSYSTVYAHASRILVSRGQVVNKGDKIALVGSTGNSTGPHLHFEIRLNDVPQDPLRHFTR